MPTFHVSEDWKGDTKVEVSPTAVEFFTPIVAGAILGAVDGATNKAMGLIYLNREKIESALDEGNIPEVEELIDVLGSRLIGEFLDLIRLRCMIEVCDFSEADRLLGIIKGKALKSGETEYLDWVARADKRLQAKKAEPPTPASVFPKVWKRYHSAFKGLDNQGKYFEVDEEKGQIKQVESFPSRTPRLSGC